MSPLTSKSPRRLLSALAFVAVAILLAVFWDSRQPLPAADPETVQREAVSLPDLMAGHSARPETTGSSASGANRRGQELPDDAEKRPEPKSVAADAGRAAHFDLDSLGSLAAWKRGDSVVIPLLAGAQVTGTVNLVQSDPDGMRRIGGSLTGERTGSFVFGTGRQQTGGLVMLPKEELAYVIGVEPDGKLWIREKPLSEVICSRMPKLVDPTKLATAVSGVQAVPPLLSSRPAATAVVYLDFDGETVTDPFWNGGNTIVAAPADMTNAEISESWVRVKEDFWPFNIDVTTNLQRYLNAPVGRRMRVIITPTDAAAPGSGGVAGVDSFSNSGVSPNFSSTIPCWVFGQSIIDSSAAISHEIGHTLGLRHDGRPGQGYYAGHGDGAVGWAPIMGLGYYRSLVQWSKGEYADANNQEDDLALIGSIQNGFGLVADDAGNSRPAAAPLSIAGGVVNQVGIITQASDSDFYAFSVANPSSVTITASPAAISPNLDLWIELQNSSGTVLTSSNPDLALDAGFSFGLSPGNYYLKISGTGRGTVLGDGYSSYGSIGHYSLGGSIAPVGLSVISSAAAVDGLTGEPFAYQIVASNTPSSYAVTGTLPPGLNLNSGTGLISGTPSSAGVYPVSLRATNPVGTGTAPLTISVVAGAFVRNATAVVLPDSGQATPYPSSISVSGFNGLAGKVSVKLYQFSHAYPDDVDVLLVGPGGQTVLLLSDVGGSADVSGVNLTFDDAAVASAAEPLTSGTFKPTNRFSADDFALPAPAGPYGGALNTFNQTNPNGTWRLFVMDDAGGDLGAFSGGWSLGITTLIPVLAINPPTANVGAGSASHDFTVTSNIGWTWSSNASWVTGISEPANQLGNQTFSYTVAANTTSSNRTAVVSLSGGGLTVSYTITQAGGLEYGYLQQTLANQSQSTWFPQNSNSLVDARLATNNGLFGDVFDRVGWLAVETRSAFGTVTATNLWGNHGVAAQSGTFSATFSTTPSGNAVDTVLGFSNGPADWWDDLAASVRFGPNGTVDACNGSDFAAVSPLNYAAGVSYLVEMEINVVTKRYRATVTPAGGVPVVIANNYAFRTEQAAISRLTHFSCLTWTGGTQTVSGLQVPSLGKVTATNVWGNYGVNPQRKSVVASFWTTPGGNAVDTLLGFSAVAAELAPDLAACVRFNPQGRIDARNGGVFAAAAELNYSAGVAYRITMEIEVVSKRYWATVTPAGGSPVLIANNYAFRTEQSAVTELTNFGYLTWTGGTQTIQGLVVSDFGAVTATNLWANHELIPHDGIFLASFSTIPSSSAMDTSLGFSSAAADSSDDLAAFVRFNDQGTIDARNGAVFAAESALTYAAGVSYLVEMEINVPQKRYSVSVTPAGGPRAVIAYNYVFRTEQNAVTALANFACLAWTGGTQSVRGFAVSGTKAELPPLLLTASNGPLASVSTAEETRVEKEIRLVPGLHATDEIITVQNLSGRARQITIQLSDNYGSDSATVVHATSSGDSVVGPDDHWFVSSDQSTTGISDDPSLMVSWIYSAKLQQPNLIQVPGAGSDQLQFYFAATLAGGEQATLTIRRQLFESASDAITQGQPLGSGIADLANLTLSAGPIHPVFAPALTNYSASVPNALASVTVTPTVAQPGATVRVNSGVVSSGSASLGIGLTIGGNPISIEVTAADGTTTKGYTLNVTRTPTALQAWRQSWFGIYDNFGNAADLADSDQDGLANLVEFGFGLNPTSGASVQVPQGRTTGGNYVVDFSAPAGVSGIQYGAAWSATMAPGDWHPIIDTGSANDHIFSIPVSGHSRRFVRLSVTSSP